MLYCLCEPGTLRFLTIIKMNLGINYYVNVLGSLGNNRFQLKWRFGTHGDWKNQNPGGRFGASS